MTLGLEESGFALLERCSVKVNMTILTSRLISLRAGCLVSVIGFAPCHFSIKKKKIGKGPQITGNKAQIQRYLLLFQSYGSLLRRQVCARGVSGKARIGFCQF